jgi:ribosomal protein L7/L12
MELTYILIAVLIVVLPIILAKLLSGSRDTKKVLGAEPRSKPPSVRERAAVPTAGEAVRQEVGRLLARDRKLDAIKLMREKSGLGLKEARNAVELMEKLPASAPPPPGLVATIRRAQELVAKGQKIQAIKLIREQTGMGLKEAKDLVDRLG